MYRLLCLLLLATLMRCEAWRWFNAVADDEASHDNEVVVRCTNAESRMVKLVMAQSQVDIWRVSADGSVDMRMSRPLARIAMRHIDGCRVLLTDVSAHLKAIEGEKEPEATLREKWQVRDLFPEEDMYNIHLSVSEVTELKKLAGLAVTEELNGEELDWFKKYHDYSSILAWYRGLATSYPQLTKFVPKITEEPTEEGRYLSAIHITAPESAAHPKAKRKRLYMQCLIHAREWISGSVCMYISKHLTSNYASDAEVKKLLDDMEFIIVPVVNPDGYVHTWKYDRLWRKNKAHTNSFAGCRGVDLNRNYPTGWDVVGGSSNSACSYTYRGPSKASEPEVKATMSYFKKFGPIAAAVDFHSYGQLILRPWGFKATGESTNEHILDALGKKIAAAIKQESGSVYTSEHASDLYRACGVASDWFYSKDANIGDHKPASFTIELRDTGGDGFLLSPDKIIATSKEAMTAIMVLANKVLINPLM